MLQRVAQVQRKQHGHERADMEQIAEHQAQTVDAVGHELEIHELQSSGCADLDAGEMPQTNRRCREQNGTAKPTARRQREQCRDREGQEGVEIRRHHRS